MRLFVITATITVIIGSFQIACTDAKSKSNNLTYKKNTWTDSIPEPIGYVNDFENIFTEKEEESLTRIIDSIEKATTIQIAVVCWDKNTMPNKEFFELNLATAKKWGVGQKGKNYGIFIGICLGVRKIRILNGYGIEAVYTDEETSLVLNETIFPYFKQSKYYEGIKAGILRMISELKGRL
jgi:uncharacterized protein